MRRPLALIPAAILAWGVLVIGQPAQAGVLPMGSADALCQASGKVYVKATYQGGTAASGCVQPDTGLRVLRAVASLNFDSGSMICQINSVPSTCPDKASLQAYWTYWLWSGSSWRYSGVGPASHRAEAGDVEAWNWGNSSTPPPWTPSAPATKPSATTTTAKPTVSATTKPTTSKPTTSKPTTTSSRTTTATSSRSSTSKATTTTGKTGATTSRPGSTSPSATVTPSSTSASPSQGAAVASPSVTSDSTTAQPDASITPEVTTSATSDRGSPWGTLATLGILGLGGAGFALRARWRA